MAECNDPTRFTSVCYVFNVKGWLYWYIHTLSVQSILEWIATQTTLWAPADMDSEDSLVHRAHSFISLLIAPIPTEPHVWTNMIYGISAH